MTRIGAKGLLGGYFAGGWQRAIKLVALFDKWLNAQCIHTCNARVEFGQGFAVVRSGYCHLSPWRRFRDRLDEEKDDRLAIILMEFWADGPENRQILAWSRGHSRPQQATARFSMPKLLCSPSWATNRPHCATEFHMIAGF